MWWGGSGSPKYALPSPVRSSGGWTRRENGCRMVSPWSGSASPTGPEPMAVVLITGGNRGIGAACVRWFLAHGDQVASTFRSAERPATPEGFEADRFLAV